MLTTYVALAIVGVKSDRSLHIADELLLLTVLVEVRVSGKSDRKLVIEASKHNLDFKVPLDLAVCILCLKLISDILFVD